MSRIGPLTRNPYSQYYVNKQHTGYGFQLRFAAGTTTVARGRKTKRPSGSRRAVSV